MKNQTFNIGDKVFFFQRSGPGTLIIQCGFIISENTNNFKYTKDHWYDVQLPAIPKYYKMNVRADSLLSDESQIREKFEMLFKEIQLFFDDGSKDIVLGRNLPQICIQELINRQDALAQGDPNAQQR